MIDAAAIIATAMRVVSTVIAGASAATVEPSSIGSSATGSCTASYVLLTVLKILWKILAKCKYKVVFYSKQGF